MDIEQLRYFTVIAAHQNLSKAQEELHIAQPALSTGLARLEKQLGVPLFDRYKGRLRLNNYGQTFLPYAQSICNTFSQAQTALAAELELRQNYLTIAILDWGFSPKLLPDFSISHPEVSVNSIMISIAATAPDASLQKCDLAITPFPMPFSNAVQIPLLRDQLFLAVPASHSLFSRNSVCLEDLNGQCLLLSGMQMHFGRFILDLLKEHNIQPSRIEGCIAENVKELLSLKNAVCPVVDGIRRRISADSGIRFLPIVPVCYRISGIAYSEQRPLSPAAAEFLRYAKSYCAELPNAVAPQ